ncbi:hypothetical protein KEM56_005976 [Ascosphaera pollenicola]|nr:hypothetical protein KEM56_005976 [Ascosphaera pollenicola]
MGESIDQRALTLEECERALEARERELERRQPTLGVGNGQRIHQDSDDGTKYEIEETGLDLGQFLDEDYDDDPKVAKATTRFYVLAKCVPSCPVTLYDSLNYNQWSEAIITHAQCVSAHRLLKGREIPEQPLLCAVWNRYNSWLYLHIWNSISPQTQDQITPPKSRYAYDLWEAVAHAFCERDDIQRSRLWNTIIDLNNDAKVIGDKRYLEKVQSCKIQLECMGVKYDDAIYFDTVRQAVSNPVCNFMQTKLDEALYCGDTRRCPDQDFDQFLKNVFVWLPSLDKMHPTQVNATKVSKTSSGSNEKSSYQSVSTTTSKEKKPQVGTKPKAKQTYPSCPHCSRTNHPKANCFTKYPEKATGRLKKFFRKKNDDTRTDTNTSATATDVQVHMAKDPRTGIANAPVYMITIWLSNAKYASEGLNKTDWILDSACSQHVTGQSLA